MLYIKMFEQYFEHENIVYHGSPYDFDSFSINMIGEGEGASGWGHGIYFTSDYDDAEEYARKLETKLNSGVVYECEIPPYYMFYNLNDNLEEQTDFVKERLMNIPNKYKILFLENDFDFNEFKKDIDDNIDEYDFNIGDDKYKSFLQDILDTEFKSFGNHLFSIMEEKLGDEYNASMFLKELGIKGNVHNSFHYDNYIVFDDEDIEIIDKHYRTSDIVNTEIDGIYYHGTTMDEGFFDTLDPDYSDWGAIWFTDDSNIADEFSDNSGDENRVMFKVRLKSENIADLSMLDTANEYMETQGVKDLRETIPHLVEEGFDGWITTGSIGSHIYDDIAIFNEDCIEYLGISFYEDGDWSDFIDIEEAEEKYEEINNI